MPTITRSQALVRANQIRTETTPRANTAERIGSLYVDLFDSLFFANAPYSVSSQDLLWALDSGAVARPLVTVDAVGHLVLRGRDANGVDVEVSNTATSYINGLRVRASTAATNPVQIQNSPALVVESQGYDTDGNASIAVGFGWVSVPVPGTTVTGRLRQLYGLNGSYMPTGVEFDHLGNFYVGKVYFGTLQPSGSFDGTLNLPYGSGFVAQRDSTISANGDTIFSVGTVSGDPNWLSLSSNNIKIRLNNSVYWNYSASQNILAGSRDSGGNLRTHLRVETDGILTVQGRDALKGVWLGDRNGVSLYADSSVSYVQLDGTGTGNVVGFLARAGSAATNLAQSQHSPYTGAEGQGWDTDNSVSQTVHFGYKVVPVPGTNVTGYLQWGYGIGTAWAPIPLAMSSQGRFYFGTGLNQTAADGHLNIPYGGPFVVGLAEDGVTYATLMAWLSINGDHNWLSLGHSSYKTRIGSSIIAIGAVTPNTTPITIRFANTTNGAGALITQDATALVIRGDSKNAGTNQNGLPAYIDGGKPTGTGRRGSAALRLNPDDVVANGQFLVEAAEVVAGRRVLALLGISAADTTKLPANTGDGVLHLGRAQTSPTATPGSGALKWVDPATDNLESWSIGDTNIRYGAFVARFRASNGNWTNLGGSEIEVRVASSGSATSGLSTRVTGQFLTGSGASSTAGPGEIRGGDNQGTGAAFTFKGGTAMVRAGDASGSGGGGTYVGGDLWLRPGTGGTRVGNTMLGASDPTAFNWQSMQRGFCVDMAVAKPTANPPSTKVWMYVDPNDLRLRVQDESGDLSMTVPIGTPLADANATLVVSTASIRHMPAATMTASRTLVIDDQDAVTNELFEIYRFDETATRNLVIQNHDTTPLHTIPPGKWKLVLRFNGTDWAVFTLLRLP